jgi:hypothetical protein
MAWETSSGPPGRPSRSGPGPGARRSCRRRRRARRFVWDPDASSEASGRYGATREERRTHPGSVTIAAPLACPPPRANRAGRARPPPPLPLRIADCGLRIGGHARLTVTGILGVGRLRESLRPRPVRGAFPSSFRNPQSAMGRSAWLRGAEADARLRRGPEPRGERRRRKGSGAPGASAPPTGRCRGVPPGGDPRGIGASPPGGCRAEGRPRGMILGAGGGPQGASHSSRTRPVAGDAGSGGGSSSRAARRALICLQAVPRPSWRQVKSPQSQWCPCSS